MQLYLSDNKLVKGMCNQMILWLQQQLGMGRENQES